MKFSAALSLCVAPLALAKAVHNVYPVRRDITSLNPRANEKNNNNNNNNRNGNNNNNNGINLSNEEAALLLGQQIGQAQAAQLLQEIIIIWVNAGAGAATQIVNSQITVTQTRTVTAGGAVATGAANAANTQAAAATVIQGASGTVAATGATHTVTVGGPAGTVYSPTSISAAIGDMVIFTFLGNNHTVTQSAFATPCEVLAGGMDSGFQPNVNNTVNPPPQVAMQVMVSTPLWFFCAQKGHCGKGMTFSINPTADKTQAMFESMAIAQNGTGGGTGITGGTTSAASVATASATLAATGTETAAAVGATDTATASTGSTGVTTGTGTLVNGQCQCAVACSSNSFPIAAAQGVGNFGGLGGSLPANMLMVV